MACDKQPFKKANPGNPCCCCECWRHISAHRWMTVYPDGNTGQLTTRTDDDTGIVTLGIDHNILTGVQLIDALWLTRSRQGMTVSVSGTAVTIDGGSGDPLPESLTSITIRQRNDWNPIGTTCTTWKARAKLAGYCKSSILEDDDYYGGYQGKRSFQILRVQVTAGGGRVGFTSDEGDEIYADFSGGGGMFPSFTMNLYEKAAGQSPALLDGPFTIAGSTVNGEFWTDEDFSRFAVLRTNLSAGQERAAWKVTHSITANMPRAFVASKDTGGGASFGCNEFLFNRTCLCTWCPSPTYDASQYNYELQVGPVEFDLEVSGITYFNEAIQNGVNGNFTTVFCDTEFLWTPIGACHWQKKFYVDTGGFGASEGRWIVKCGYYAATDKTRVQVQLYWTGTLQVTWRKEYTGRLDPRTLNEALTSSDALANWSNFDISAATVTITASP